MYNFSSFGGDASLTTGVLSTMTTEVASALGAPTARCVCVDQ